MNTLKVESLEEYIKGLKYLFDEVRVVKPDRKKETDKDFFKEVIYGKNCHNLWSKDQLCDRCIAKEAWIHNQTFTKVEYTKDSLFIVTAAPVEFESHTYIVEVLKDIGSLDVMIELNGVDIKDTNEMICELNDKVLRDDLTDIYNRRYINDILPREIELSKIRGEKSSLIMIDIDNFKQINDRYGYMVGDLVLRELAKMMKSKIREGHDWIARYGGDEFLIFLRKGNKKTAEKIIDKISTMLNKKYFNIKGNSFKIGISSGIAILDCGDKSFIEIIDESDVNLKKDKNRQDEKQVKA